MFGVAAGVPRADAVLLSVCEAACGVEAEALRASENHNDNERKLPAVRRFAFIMSPEHPEFGRLDLA